MISGWPYRFSPHVEHRGGQHPPARRSGLARDGGDVLGDATWRIEGHDLET